MAKKVKLKVITISPEKMKAILETRIEANFIAAIGTTVTILRTSEEETTKGGIILTEGNDGAKSRGTVMAVGGDVNRKFIDFRGELRSLRPGDKVLINSYGNLTTTFNSISYVNIDQLDVKAVLPEGTTVMLEKHADRKGKLQDWEK